MSGVVVYKQWLEESERRVFQRPVKVIKEHVLEGKLSAQNMPAI